MCLERPERYPYTPGSHGAPKRGARRGRTGAVGATAHTKGQRRPAAGSRGMGWRGGRPAHTKPDFAPTGPRPPSPVHCSPFSTSALVTFNPWGPAVTLIPAPRGKKSSAPQRFYVLASCRDRCPPTRPPRRTVSPLPPPSASQSALDQPRPPRKGDPLLTSVSLAAMSSAGAWGRHPIRPSPSASLGPWPTGGDQWVCAELLGVPGITPVGRGFMCLQFPDAPPQEQRVAWPSRASRGRPLRPRRCIPRERGMWVARKINETYARN